MRIDRRGAARLFVVVGVAAALLPGCTTPPPIRDAGYQLVFQDGFNGSTPEPSVWATAPFGNSLPATTANGVMTLQATAANNHHWGYVASTGPRRAAEPNYPDPTTFRQGYFEARIRYSGNPWAWPAFWMFGMAKSEAWTAPGGPNEDCRYLNAEWDIMENGVENSDGLHPATSWYYTNLHRNTRDGTIDGYCGQQDTERSHSIWSPITDLSDWHVWAGRWENGLLCTYIDNIPIQCTPAFDSTAQAMHLTFSIQYLGSCLGCGPRPDRLDLQVDWVRVWQKR